ncbi:hypothetical protein XBP1_2460004 [Xenorhabdus bovienii str. puntauvense]|uniref:Transposase n=1 Tax=Xenorhabdus bovienii str. puntauvense TaxID=1398201 RepID=A0A077N4N5_XENBV|nr:hypothetical protein XBP1_2460004 [Xenorhabdus bovienii str. puntauvense]
MIKKQAIGNTFIRMKLKRKFHSNSLHPGGEYTQATTNWIYDQKLCF